MPPPSLSERNQGKPVITSPLTSVTSSRNSLVWVLNLRRPRRCLIHPRQVPPSANNAAGPTSVATSPTEDPNKKKKGFFGKIFGAFKGDNKDNNSNPPSGSTSSQPH